MANTVIALKKSDTPNQVPSNLANGEIAINYADGKIFYKNVTGHIVSISASANVYSFSTVNANGSLLTATTANSTLTLLPGSNIEISSDIINDIITMSANLAPAFDIANAAFNAANNAGGDVSPIFNRANDAYDKANTANVLAYDTGIGANNFAGYMANAANSYASSLTPDVSAPFDRANGAFLVANSALQKISNDSLTFTQSIPLTGPNLSNTAGERIIIWPQRPSGAYYNYSIGLEHDAIWFGVDIGLSTTGFKWYQGNTQIMELSRNANLTIKVVNTSNIKFDDATVQSTAFRYDLLNVSFDVANSAYSNVNATLTLAQAAFDRANLSNEIGRAHV